MKAVNNHRTRRILRRSAGYACLVGGVAGCVLPIIPGIPLLIGGLTLLSPETPWAARLLGKLKEKLRRKGNAPAVSPDTH